MYTGNLRQRFSTKCRSVKPGWREVYSNESYKEPFFAPYNIGGRWNEKLSEIRRNTLKKVRNNNSGVKNDRNVTLLNNFFKEYFNVLLKSSKETE